MQRNRLRLAAAFAAVAPGSAGLSGPAMGQDKFIATHVFPANFVDSRSFLEFVKKANEAGKGQKRGDHGRRNEALRETDGFATVPYHYARAIFLSRLPYSAGERLRVAIPAAREHPNFGITGSRE